MKCPYCAYQESKVVDSRHSDDSLSIRRRQKDQDHGVFELIQKALEHSLFSGFPQAIFSKLPSSLLYLGTTQTHIWV